MRTDRTADRMTNPQTDTSTDNKGFLKLSAREPTNVAKITHYSLLLVNDLVTWRHALLDYCNAVLAASPKTTTDKLQHCEECRWSPATHGITVPSRLMLVYTYTLTYTGSTFPSERVDWNCAVFYVPANTV